MKKTEIKISICLTGTLECNVHNMIIDLDTLCRRHIPCEIQLVVISPSCIVWVILVIVTLVAVVLIRGLVWAAATIDLLVVVEALFIDV